MISDLFHQQRPSRPFGDSTPQETNTPQIICANAAKLFLLPVVKHFKCRRRHYWGPLSIRWGPSTSLPDPAFIDLSLILVRILIFYVQSTVL